MQSARQAGRRTLLCLFAAIATPGWARTDIPLGPGDVLTLRFQGREALSGDYPIGPDGLIFVPGLGEIGADGRSLEQITGDLDARMQRAFGVSERSFGITVKDFRPVYVDGGVVSPGAFAFVPGLRVAQGVALAGGFRRFSTLDPVIGLELSRDHARLREAEDELADALLRRDRFRAQLGQGPAADSGAELGALLEGDDLAARRTLQAALTAARDTLTETRRTILQTRAAVADGEIKALDARLDALGELITLSGEELALLEDPSERGVIPRTRILELRRLIVTTSGEQSETVARRFGAESNRASFQGEEQQLEQANRVEDAFGLIAAQAEVDRLRQRVTALRGYLSDIGGDLPSRGQTCELVIWRGAGADLTVIDATETTPLHPGDLLRVIRGNARGFCGTGRE